jgi:Holliday junction resolvase RusA-like endonuclease
VGRTYRLEFPPATKLINANGRSSKYAVSAQSRFARAKVTAILRSSACLMAKQMKIPELERVRVTAVYFPPDNRRRDSPNVLFHSSKAALDGCTDAGVWRDDNDKTILSLELVPGGHIVPGGQMVIIISEAAGD